MCYTIITEREVRQVARQLMNGKWNPVVYSNGYVGMTDLINGEWKLVECDTKEDAEHMEKEYRDFWSN